MELFANSQKKARMPVERPNNNLVTGHINEIVCEYKLVFVVTQELGVL